MNNLVLDTHSLLWYLEKSSKLSETARSCIRQAIESGGLLYVSPVSLTEILFLEEKGKLRSGTFKTILAELQRPDTALAESPLVIATVEFIAQIPHDVLPDMPDRMIAATALSLGAQLVTRDLRIRASAVPTVW